MTAGLRDNWEAMQAGIRGWVRPDMLDILTALNDCQRACGITGHLGEIGLHCGKLLIALSWLARDGEVSVGFDCFEDKHFNVDNSGAGDRAEVEANIARFGPSPTKFSLIKTDSLALNADEFGPFRFFSVDGGHTQRHAFSDTRFAEQTLSDGGIIMIDDYPHTGWPGVKSGVDQFFADGGRLAPFLLASNKLFLTTSNHYGDYAQVMQVDEPVWQEIYGYPVPVVKGGGWPWP